MTPQTIVPSPATTQVSPRVKDISDQVFGLLSVKEFAGFTSKGRALWLCECACGEKKVMRGTALRAGAAKSCGCLKSSRLLKHGHSRVDRRSSEYTTWKGMKARCQNENTPEWIYYGGRGITVCGRWGNSFENFLTDMGIKPSPEYSLDRIYVNGNYEPSNCRWATASQQATNKRDKSRCRNGHYLSEDNVKIVHRKGLKCRSCLTCSRARNRRNNLQKRKESAKRFHRAYSTVQKMGTNGRKACLECDGDIIDRKRRTFCNKECSEAFLIRSRPDHARLRVFERDKGICANCQKNVFADTGRIPRSRGTGDLWQADHIITVAEGGGNCSLDNLRTLCTSCHKQETVKLMKRLWRIKTAGDWERSSANAEVKA